MKPLPDVLCAHCYEPFKNHLGETWACLFAPGNQRFREMTTVEWQAYLLRNSRPHFIVSPVVQADADHLLVEWSSTV